MLTKRETKVKKETKDDSATITTFTLRWFKKYELLEVDCTKLLLVGQNNSGKTTVLQALFLFQYLATQATFEAVLQKKINNLTLLFYSRCRFWLVSSRPMAQK